MPASGRWLHLDVPTANYPANSLAQVGSETAASHYDQWVSSEWWLNRSARPSEPAPLSLAIAVPALLPDGAIDSVVSLPLLVTFRKLPRVEFLPFQLVAAGAERRSSTSPLNSENPEIVSNP